MKFINYSLYANKFYWDRIWFFLAGTIVTGVFLILTLVFSIISWPPYADYLLNKYALFTNAKISEDPKVVSYRKRSGVPNRVSLKISFNGLDKGNIVNVTAFPSPDYKKGAQIEIEYLRDNPSIVRVKGDQYGIFNHKVVLPMLFGVIIGIILFLKGITI